MALGGGIYTNTNKTLPGAYINIVSASRSAGVIGERGVVAFAYPLSWGETQAVIEVTAEDFYNNSSKIFGYKAEEDEMTLFREVFKHAQKIYVYNTRAYGFSADDSDGEGTVRARYAGEAGNKIKIKFEKLPQSFEVIVRTYFDDILVDAQRTAIDYIDDKEMPLSLKDNDYVIWRKNAGSGNYSFPDITKGDITLAGGSDGTEASDHTDAIKALSHKSFNVMCAFTTDATNIEKYITACKEARDNDGNMYQVLVYNTPNENHEGVVNLGNAVAISANVPAHGLLAWTAGAMAACPLNSSLTNFTYDGELDINVNYTQKELEDKLVNGVFMFHEVGNSIRVLDDINSYVSDTSEKTRDIFGFNQSIRIVDQTASDIASIFNDKYSGKIQNNDAGRIALWSDLVSYYKELERIGAIEGFTPNSDLTIDAVSGNRRAVNVKATITIVNTMTQLYMTVLVK